MYTIKQISEITGLTKRALHHYDEIGLFSPSEKSDAGYRLYSDEDLLTLQQILFFKELGFELNEIKRIINDPFFNHKQALNEHKKLLLEKKKRLESLIETVEQTLENIERRKNMAMDEIFDGFDQKHIEEYKEEAKQRWGGTKEYEESQKKTSKYTKKDWDMIKQESGDIYSALALMMDREVTDSEVQGEIKKHHEHINNRFYTCSIEIYEGLAEGYIGDIRFKEFFEKIKPGFAQFMHDAMKIYCQNYKK